MSAQNPFTHIRRPRAAASDGSVTVRVTQADIAAARARQVEWDRMVAIINGQSGDVDEAPENDPDPALAALRAAATSGRFAHLAAPLMDHEADMRVSEVQAALRRAGGIDPPGGAAGFILAAAEKGRVTDATPPDVNSTNRAEATAAFVLDAFRRAHEKDRR